MSRFLQLVEEARAKIRETTVPEVHRRIEAGDRFCLIDVREESEWLRGRIPGANWLGKGVIERDVERAIPDAEAEIILYCGGGHRSASRRTPCSGWGTRTSGRWPGGSGNGSRPGCRSTGGDNRPREGRVFLMMRVLLRQTTLPLLAFVLACSVSGPGDREDPLVRMAEARQAWQASGISVYELAMRRSCGGCPPWAALAVIVSVSAGEKTVSLAQNGEPVEDLPELYPDVEGLFDLIEDMVLAGAEVEVDYDDDRGYPRSVSVDRVPDAVDDEFGYVIDELIVGRLAGLRAQLRVQRERWAAQRIEDYQLTFSRSCFCPPEGAGLVVLNVLEGEPVEWLYFLSGDPIPPEWQAVFPTVDGLFDFIEDAIDRGAETIDVTYDAEIGLPVAVRVDYRLALADEEVAYEVEKLLPFDSGEPPTPGRAAR